MRMSDWSSDVCSSDLDDDRQRREDGRDQGGPPGGSAACRWRSARGLLGLAESGSPDADHEERRNLQEQQRCGAEPRGCLNIERIDNERPDHHDAGKTQEGRCPRSEEHTSELQSLMRISYAVFCLNK